MKTAFVTGGSSDIGRAITHLLKAGEWWVIAPTHYGFDLADLSSVSGMVEKLVADAPTIDAVVRVAGVWHDRDTAFQKDLEDYTPEQITNTMHVGLTGFMLTLSKLLPKRAEDNSKFYSSFSAAVGPKRGKIGK